MTDDVKRAAEWASDFAARFPEVDAVYLVGSRATGRATPDSDYDVILLVQRDSPLARRETLIDSPVGGWLMLDEAASLGFAPDGQECDLCIVVAEGVDADAVALFLKDAVPLWAR